MVRIQSFGEVWTYDNGVVTETTDPSTSNKFTRYAGENINRVGGHVPDIDIELARMFVSYYGGKILSEDPNNGEVGEIN